MNNHQLTQSLARMKGLCALPANTYVRGLLAEEKATIGEAAPTDIAEALAAWFAGGMHTTYPPLEVREDRKVSGRPRDTGLDHLRRPPVQMAKKP